MIRTLIIAAIALASCGKQTPTAPVTSSTVKPAVFDGRKNGLLHWKPGVIFTPAINASGTVTVRWYFGGTPGFPFFTGTHTMNFSVSETSNSYFEISDYRKGDPTWLPDSARIVALTIDQPGLTITIGNR